MSELAPPVTPTPDDAIILLYHGVTEEVPVGIRNHSGKHIASKAFERQMRFLREHCHPVSLRVLVELMNSGASLPERTVAVTFDDAFANVFHHGYPTLARYDIPATLFLTTGYIDTDRVIWADQLELLVDAWPTESWPVRLGSDDRRLPMGTAAQRVEALVEVKRYLKRAPETEKREIVDRLVGSFDVATAARSSENYVNLTWTQVATLDRDPLIELGGHTVNHQILSLIDVEEAHAEIHGACTTLTERLGHPIDLFSYPEGQAHHYNQAVIDLLRAEGVICSPSATPGSNPPGSDPFHFRRVMVGFMGMPFPYEGSDADWTD
jgi:peptidoglycan/xylan/chitin deacetylase (PgdA/CDA1 family)